MALGALNGTVEEEDISGTITIETGGLVETNGVIADAGAVLEGTYTVISGQCTGEQGTFVVQRPVNNPNDNLVHPDDIHISLQDAVRCVKKGRPAGMLVLNGLIPAMCRVAAHATDNHHDPEISPDTIPTKLGFPQ